MGGGRVSAKGIWLGLRIGDVYTFRPNLFPAWSDRLQSTGPPLILHRGQDFFPQP